MMRGKGIFCAAFLAGMAALTALDQWTKALAVRCLMNQSPVVLVDGVFQLHYSENRGAAFGMLQGKQFFFFFITLAVLAAAAYMVWHMPPVKRFLPMWFALLLVASGAVGNMIDRDSQGYVVDFLYFNLINFPIFNVADCYVTIGAFLLVILIFFYYREDEMACFSLKKKKEGVG